MDSTMCYSRQTFSARDPNLVAGLPISFLPQIARQLDGLKNDSDILGARLRAIEKGIGLWSDLAGRLTPIENKLRDFKKNDVNLRIADKLDRVDQEMGKLAAAVDRMIRAQKQMQVEQHRIGKLLDSKVSSVIKMTGCEPEDPSQSLIEDHDEGTGRKRKSKHNTNDPAKNTRRSRRLATR
ncbi:hypothetical protein ANO11243_097190 [Dothideomycetidae sp. 11243]|nr:hypothetical protein ANO11243_097190 [fungal sp. No.11243]